ncbi:related to acriflavine sensitivity control protein ACR-2 [Cephalotrichum gorgonifer]|uniref:Related to acriflavine sensitivity control protein ACR-2 n=1 Tax=Cephalotrichum gorgonifer TaxID=2041049 RepID=A0AAE8MX98_9PEZI|nr:related to acriflavine sensitivity control protein ACR-2 [Cephalotrichum gorgonifer]
MPRPKKPGAPEPKRRSRTGCWQCKSRKVKCGEERPACVNCQKAGHSCDYSIRLNWDGRRTKRTSYDGSSDNPVSPTREQRHFTIINQTFAPEGDNLLAQVQPSQTQQRIKEESLSDDQAASDGEDGDGEALSWVPKYQSPRTYAGGLTKAASQPTNADSPSADQVFRTGFTDDRPTRTLPRRFSGQQQLVGLAGHYDPCSVDDLNLPGSSSSAGYAVDHAGVSTRKRRATDSMTTPVSFGETIPPTSMRFQHPPLPAMLTSPSTPATPSSYSDEEPRLFAPVQAGGHSNSSFPDNPRLAAKSSLPRPSNPIYNVAERAFGASSSALDHPSADSDESTDLYGYDLGLRDEDMGKNDDQNAISTVLPSPLTPREQTQEFPQGGGWGSDDAPTFNLPFRDRSQRRPSGILMPYDDLESNPFRIILPQMAVKSDHLMSLLLAYSASHRARLLQQREPAMRMAHWVEDIFPALRAALDDDARTVSIMNLATAIMLASLEIISPTAFGFPIPWQEHLNLARDLMRKRFGGHRRMHSTNHEDQVYSFLWSWFAYLDVLGSLSGGPRRSESHLSLPMGGDDDPDEIDCIMGFTTRCLHLLSQTADLARSSDLLRIEAHSNRVDPHWRPTPATARSAKSLEAALRDSLSRHSQPCTHIPPAPPPSGRNSVEMAATNEAFHWAAIIQLHRRALGKPSSHADVQGPVRRIMACLARIRSGTAEMGMLFPMFTAGCEVESSEARDEILERFRNVERNGMTQIRRARELMEKVWNENKPWETMIKNEFIG